MRRIPLRSLALTATAALLLSSGGIAQSGWAHSHVRFEYPPNQALPGMPVVENLEAQPPGMTELMAPLGTKCNQVPVGNHKRWVVKTSIMKPLASQSVLTQAMSKPYQASDFISARNLSGAVSRTSLNRSESVEIAHDQHFEGDPIAVHGVILALGCEADGDTHVDIAPSLKSATCVVVEVPNPKDIGPQADAERAFLTSMWEPLRRRFTEIYDDSGEVPSVPYEVTVVGQLYFDTDHRDANDTGGGRGIIIDGRICARNLWEVHSVLDMTEQNH